MLFILGWLFRNCAPAVPGEDHLDSGVFSHQQGQELDRWIRWPSGSLSGHASHASHTMVPCQSHQTGLHGPTGQRHGSTSSTVKQSWQDLCLAFLRHPHGGCQCFVLVVRPEAQDSSLVLKDRKLGTGRVASSQSMHRGCVCRG